MEKPRINFSKVYILIIVQDLINTYISKSANAV